MPHIAVHSVRDVLQPVAVGLFIADIVIADPLQRQLGVSCCLFLTQVHVQRARVFRPGLIDGVVNLAIAEGLRPFPFGEILDEKP